MENKIYSDSDCLKLYNLCKKSTKWYIKAIKGHPDKDAFDILYTEVYVRVFEKLATVKTLKGYVSTVARNTVIEYYMHMKKETTKITAVNVLENTQTTLTKKFTSVLTREESNEMNRQDLALMRKILTNEQWDFLMLWADGYNYEEIAAQKDCDATHVRNIIHRTRKKIKELREKGYFNY